MQHRLASIGSFTLIQKQLWSVVIKFLTSLRFSKFSNTRSSKIVWNSCSIDVKRAVDSRESIPLSAKVFYQSKVFKSKIEKLFRINNMRVITSDSSRNSVLTVGLALGILSTIAVNHG